MAQTQVQEPDGTEPTQAQPTVVPPDSVIYGTFLRHAATFEKLAKANEAHGASGAFYRNHLTHKFGITADEQKKVSTITQTYLSNYHALLQKIHLETQNWRALNFPNNQHIPGTPKPALSPMLISLYRQLQQTTLQARDQVHTALGDTRFAQLDAQVRARAAKDILKVNAFEANNK